jgi:hypothetical protein
VVVHGDTLERMESVLAGDSKVAALFGSYDDAPPAPGLASRYKNLQHHYVHQHGDREAGTFWAGCGAVRRAAFLEVDGFDEVYRRPSIEDIELGIRLRRAGHRIRLCPEVQATHLKQWTLASLWRTDIFDRAVPWTRLILRQPGMPSDLNLSWRSRLAAAVAWMMLGSALLATGLALAGSNGWSPWAGGAVAVAALATLLLSGDLFRFFYRQGGLPFALGAAALHSAYLLYSSAIFASLTIQHTLRSIVRPPRDQSTP